MWSAQFLFGFPVDKTCNMDHYREISISSAYYLINEVKDTSKETEASVTESLSNLKDQNIENNIPPFVVTSGYTFGSILLVSIFLD